MSLAALIAQVKSINSTRQDVGAAFDEVSDLLDNRIVAKSNGSTTLISTNSTSATLVTGSDITIVCPSAGILYYLCTFNVSQSHVGQATRIEVFANGSIVSMVRGYDTVGYLAQGSGSIVPVTTAQAYTVSAGSNTIDTRWYSGSASYTHYSKYRYAWGFFLPS
jgi:hypothetical protein